jgi:hypothetical protein
MKNNFKLDSIKQFIDLDGEDLNDLVVRKGYLKESQLKISDDDERTILADISTQDVDSDGDIVLSKGCDLNRYLKNPIITINHSYITQDIVGSAKQIEVLDDRIRCKIKLNDTDSALNLWKQVRAGDIRGNSIGFVIKEAVIKGTKEFDTIQKMYNLKTNDAKRIITKFLLIENSIVALPANPDALNVEVSKKSLDVKVEDYIIIDDKIQKHMDRINNIRGLTKEEVDQYMDDYKEFLLTAISYNTTELLKEQELEAIKEESITQLENTQLDIKKELKELQTSKEVLFDIGEMIKDIDDGINVNLLLKDTINNIKLEQKIEELKLDFSSIEDKINNIKEESESIIGKNILVELYDLIYSKLSNNEQQSKKELPSNIIQKEESIPQVLIIERLGGLDIKQMYEDYKNGKII